MSEQKVCSFIKPRKNRGNIRKKEGDYSAIEDNSSVNIAKKQKTSTGGLLATSKRESEKEDLTYKSSGSSSNMDVKNFATRELETEPVFERREEQVLTGEEAERAEAASSKIYKGMKGYKEFLDRREESGLQKGAGIRSGPIRATSHIYISTRFDYALDICKDYKETGYCGYGDSCKYLHDRGDYKTGWQIDKEWEEQQKSTKGSSKDDQSYEIKEDDNIPFACAICRQPFVNPIVTRCKHYFCERCALQRFKKNMKCAVCAENTFGSFSCVSDKIKRRMHEKWEEVLANGEHLQPGDDEEEEVQMEPDQVEEEPQLENNDDGDEQQNASPQEQEQETEPIDEATQYILNYGK